uniref:Ovule protein n=1 Tax=Haemonchus placei TaxID=6290 RepID=A0A0N4VYZ7_HAEPC
MFPPSDISPTVGNPLAFRISSSTWYVAFQNIFRPFDNIVYRNNLKSSVITNILSLEMKKSTNISMYRSFQPNSSI